MKSSGNPGIEQIGSQKHYVIDGGCCFTGYHEQKTTHMTINKPVHQLCTNKVQHSNYVFVGNEGGLSTTDNAHPRRT